MNVTDLIISAAPSHSTSFYNHVAVATVPIFVMVVFTGAVCVHPTGNGPADDNKGDISEHRLRPADLAAPPCEPGGGLCCPSRAGAVPPAGWGFSVFIAWTGGARRATVTLTCMLLCESDLLHVSSGRCSRGISGNDAFPNGSARPD